MNEGLRIGGDMTPGELVKTVAQVLGLPEATVVVHDRNLVVAGLRSKAGRGRGSAHVNARDAAHLLTAILASAQVRDSVPSVERYRETRPRRNASTKKLFAQIGITELASLPAEHSFVDALEAMLGSAATGSLAAWLAQEAKGTRGRKIGVAPLIEVAAHTPGTLGDIRIAGVKSGATASVRYALPDPWDKSGAKQPSSDELDAWEANVRRHRSDTDLAQYRVISERTILHIAEALAADREKDR
jgi:DNA-binding Xre family transcriptional regulator